MRTKYPTKIADPVARIGMFAKCVYLQFSGHAHLLHVDTYDAVCTNNTWRPACEAIYQMKRCCHNYENHSRRRICIRESPHRKYTLIHNTFSALVINWCSVPRWPTEWARYGGGASFYDTECCDKYLRECRPHCVEYNMLSYYITLMGCLTCSECRRTDSHGAAAHHNGHIYDALALTANYTD